MISFSIFINKYINIIMERFTVMVERILFMYGNKEHAIILC